LLHRSFQLTLVERQATAKLCGRLPMVGDAADADLYEEVGEFDSRAQRAPEAEHAESKAQTAQNTRFVCNFLLTDDHGEPQCNGTRLGSEALHRLAEARIQPVDRNWRRAVFEIGCRFP